MKKVFITMLAAVAATASFAQNNPKIAKEVAATKSFEAGSALIEQKLPELNDEEKGKAYDALYKLIKPEFDKSFEAAASGNTAGIDNKVVMNTINTAVQCEKYASKDAAKNVAESAQARPLLINAANTAEDTKDKMAYALCYMNSSKDGDQFLPLASFFACYASYQMENYSDAAKYARGAFNDERVSEQAKQVFQVSMERNMKTKADSLKYAEALKELDADKYFVNIVNLYNEMGEKQLADNMVKEALEKNPNNKFAYYLLGSEANEAKKYDEAITNFKKVVEIDPEFVHGYYNLALCYGNKADDISLAKADKNGRLFGEDLKACNEAYQGAIQNLEKVREMDPNRETITNWPMQLRMYYNRLGQKDKADEISKMLGDL